MTPGEQFRDAIRAAGLMPPQVIVPGKIGRCPSSEKRGDDAGWFLLFDDQRGGVYGDHRTGLEQTWQAQSERPFSVAERDEIRRKIEKDRTRRVAEEKQRHAEAAAKAAAIWKAATPARADHPYLSRKRIPPVASLREIDAAAAILGYAPKSKGEPLTGRLLVAPVKVGDAFSTLELIDGDGRKSAIYGGAKAGGYWAAQPLPQGNGDGLILLIGEGVATALSAKESSGHPAIAALSAGNLRAVATVMRERYPAAALVILADLVKATGEPDPHAVEAAQAVGALLAVPDFGADRPERATDFNDLAQECGAEAVQRAVANARAPVTPEVQPSAGNAPVSAEWPEPLLLPAALPSVDPFDPALLPEALRPWIEDVAERVQCPPEFAAVGAMISLAAVVGRRIGICPKRQDDWLEVPNLWGAIIGRPGVMKSPALREAMRPLRRLEGLAAEGFEEEARTWRRDRELAKLQREATRSKLLRAARSDKPIDPSALPDEFAEDEPQPRRYVVNDTSHEALGVILQHNPNGVLAYRDELIGLLKSLDQEGNESARGFYLSAWNGTEGYTFDRIGRGLHQRIEACCLSLLGSIQPAVIGGYLRQAVAGAGDDGLLARFQLLVWPDVSGEWRDVDRWPDSESRKRAHDVFDRLNMLDPRAIGATAEDGSIPFLRFDDPAQALFSEWRATLEQRLRAEEEHPALESHLSKYRKLVPALALLCHLADRPGALVGEDALLKALAWAEFLEGHARRAYASVAQAEAESARHLLRRIRKGDVPNPFTLRDVYLKHWACLATREEVADAARLLVDLDWLREEVIHDTGGRPKTLYQVNPKARQA